MIAILSQYRKKAIFALPVLLFAFAGLFDATNRLTVFPIHHPNVAIIGYDDSEDNASGGSKVIALSSDSGVIRCEFQIDSGFAYPFAGFKITNPKPTEFLNVSRFNQINLEFTAKRPLPLQVSIITHITDFSTERDYLSNHYNTSLLHLKKGKISRTLNFSDLKTPQWWFERWQRHPIDVTARPEYDKTVSLQFQSSPFTPMGIPHYFEVRKVTLSRKMAPIYATLTIISALFYLMIGVWYYSKHYHAKSYHQPPQLPSIDYKPLRVENHGDSLTQNIVDYIGSNYDNPDLSLDHIVKNTGVSSHRVSQLLSKRYQRDFKQYLQNIRLSEAMRLIETTDRQVTEIANLVGFNYLSSFTRAFKKHFQITPKAVRDQSGDKKNSAEKTAC